MLHSHAEPVRGAGRGGGEHSLLSGIELFRDLDPAALARIEHLCRYRRFAADEHVIDRDGASADVYCVVRGRVRVVNYSVSGREITFDELASGSYFGELAAIDGAPRSANVIAVEDTLILALPRGAFLDAISQHPAVAARVMRRLASIVRSANERIMDLSTLAAQNRVQAELLRQAQGRERRANAAIIAPIPVHSDIASRVSTTRETVARVMNDLARKGIVERRKGALVIHDMRRLESLVEDVRG
jgi:CRP-like cAMP-binding protein